MQNAQTQTHLADRKREERIELGFHIAVGVLLAVICFCTLGAMAMEIAKAAR